MSKSREIDKIFFDIFYHGVHKEDQNAYGILVWKAEGKKPVGDREVWMGK